MKVSHALGLSMVAFTLSYGGWMVGCSESIGTNDGGLDGGNEDSGSPQKDGSGPTPNPDSGSATVAPTCQEYCELVMDSCTASEGFQQYANMGQCLLACAYLPKGKGGETSGNSIACRTYHASVAGKPGQAATHCTHAGLSGGGTCGDRCEAFCQIALGACNKLSDTPQPFATLQACTDACGKESGFPGFDQQAGGGEYAPANKNNLNCRQYHLREALNDGGAKTHCAHIGLVGVTTDGLSPQCTNP